MPAQPKRIRRTPEEARRLILEAAEAQMGMSGPAGLRLQEVARAAGVSHPTVLHHFGSRKGLIRALNLRAVEQLRSVLLPILTATPKGSQDAIGPIFAAYRNGLAQRFVWLLQEKGPVGAAGLPVYDEMIEALHAMRLRLAGPGAKIDPADTRAIVHLTTIAAFGDAMLGERLRRAKSAAEEEAMRQRFEAWFSLLLNHHVDSPG